MMRLAELQTPCALIERSVLERNVATMARRMAELGVSLRPHVKTHKCAEIARRQGGFQGDAGGITVSTLAEARFFAGHGFRDITWALPLDPERLAAVAELQRGLEGLHLLLDDPAVLAAVEAFGSAHGVRFSVFLEVDCGYHRSGVDPGLGEAFELARRLAESPVVEFRGLLTHAGHAYRCQGAAELEAVAEEERSVTAGFAAELRAQGVPVPVVSVGSTPTMSRVRDLSGVDEVRPGNYVFYDLHQEAIGSCRRRDIALSVLATVVGCYPQSGRLVLNAGALALSKDRGAEHVEGFRGYGALLTADGSRVLDHLRLTGLSQEHGHVQSFPPERAAELPVGSRVRILPNHSCLTAALHEDYVVVDGDEVIETWRPVRGW
ncbi:MAG: alanine racemase [Acidobacteria bacterium]|nr:alanine racemase [Acidobacteriota bacterium]